MIYTRLTDAECMEAERLYDRHQEIDASAGLKDKTYAKNQVAGYRGQTAVLKKFDFYTGQDTLHKASDICGSLDCICIKPSHLGERVEIKTNGYCDATKREIFLLNHIKGYQKMTKTGAEWLIGVIEKKRGTYWLLGCIPYNDIKGGVESGFFDIYEGKNPPKTMAYKIPFEMFGYIGRIAYLK